MKKRRTIAEDQVLLEVQITFDLADLCREQQTKKDESPKKVQNKVEKKIQKKVQKKAQKHVRIRKFLKDMRQNRRRQSQNIKINSQINRIQQEVQAQRIKNPLGLVEIPDLLSWRQQRQMKSRIKQQLLSRMIPHFQTYEEEQEMQIQLPGDLSAQMCIQDAFVKKVLMQSQQSSSLQQSETKPEAKQRDCIKTSNELLRQIVRQEQAHQRIIQFI